MIYLEVYEKIVSIIKQKFKIEKSISEDTQLVEDLGFDSLKILEFVMNLEEDFSILIPDDELDYEIFRDVKSVASFIHSKI